MEVAIVTNDHTGMNMALTTGPAVQFQNGVFGFHVRGTGTGGSDRGQGIVTFEPKDLPQLEALVALMKGRSEVRSSSSTSVVPDVKPSGTILDMAKQAEGKKAAKK